MREGDNEALGVRYLADSDKLKEEVQVGTPNPLTRRQLLSQIAGLYDPIGLWHLPSRFGLPWHPERNFIGAAVQDLYT